MKARSAKAKGTRLETFLAKEMDSLPGWSARKQPGSGIYQAFPHDLSIVDPCGREWIGEAKSWKNGWRTGDKALGQADILFIKRDYGEPCVYMPFSKFVEMVSPLNEVEKPE